MLKTLETQLSEIGDMAVAVSGGVDSMTLAAAAHRLARRSGARVEMLHASSPAVPPEATARVRALALEEGWRLTVIDAGEFNNARYRENPVNRCFFCKTQLYVTIRAHTTAQVVSGANLDDLGEYRPGLDAAREHGVRHPYVEAGIGKACVRQIARTLGLGDIAELPASPCLSSRIETGIRIEAPTLDFVHAVEKLVAAALGPRTVNTVRCRVRASGIVVELDDASFERLSKPDMESIEADIRRAAPTSKMPVNFARYRSGSAFLTEQT
jgi:uncharacterized protein